MVPAADLIGQRPAPYRRREPDGERARDEDDDGPQRGERTGLPREHRIGAEPVDETPGDGPAGEDTEPERG
jgi:hypothetical protein